MKLQFDSLDWEKIEKYKLNTPFITEFTNQMAKNWASILMKLPPPPLDYEYIPKIKWEYQSENDNWVVTQWPELRPIPGTILNPFAPED